MANSISVKALALLLISTGLAKAALAQNATTLFTSEKTIPLEGVNGRIDHMAADVPGQRLFVAALANNTVEVVDLKAGKRIQSLSGFAEPQGIAYVQKIDRIFVANGQDGTSRIIDGLRPTSCNSSSAVFPTRAFPGRWTGCHARLTYLPAVRPCGGWLLPFLTVKQGGWTKWCLRHGHRRQSSANRSRKLSLSVQMLVLQLALRAAPP